MTFGVRTYNAAGVVEMDTDSFTYQILYNAVHKLTMGAVITVPVPGFDTSTCAVTILPTQSAPAPDCYYAMPFMSVSSGSISVRSRHPNETDTGIGSTIQFRLLVMRYKN